MARLRTNFLTGTLSSGISATDTSISSTQFADIPAVSGDNYFPIILDPDGTAGDPEVVYVTAHSASATTLTVDSSGGNRTAKESTSARIHAGGITWVHAPTVVDFTSVNTIDLPKKSPDAIDDDFDTGSLDGKWTAVNGSSGTVTLTASTSTGIYDLVTRQGMLLVQVDNNQVSLRQSGSIDSGESLVGCFAMTALADTTSAWASSEQSIRLGVTSGSASIGDGTGVRMEVATAADSLSLRFKNANGTTNEGPEEPGVSLVGQRFYLRIHRISNTYYGFYSGNGDLWVPMGTHTISGTMAYIWIDFYSGADAGAPVPIQACEWVRVGSSNITPW